MDPVSSSLKAMPLVDYNNTARSVAREMMPESKRQIDSFQDPNSYRRIPIGDKDKKQKGKSPVFRLAKLQLPEIHIVLLGKILKISFIFYFFIPCF